MLAERKKERRTLARRRLGPDPPAVARHDTLHSREPDPRSLKVVVSMKPLKRREQLVRVLHVESRTVVAYKERAVVLADLDPRGRLLRGELPRITKQILQHHAQQLRVSRHDQIRRDQRLDAPLGFALAQLAQDLAADLRQVDSLPPQRGARDPRKTQQVVDE